MHYVLHGGGHWLEVSLYAKCIGANKYRPFIRGGLSWEERAALLNSMSGRQQSMNTHRCDIAFSVNNTVLHSQSVLNYVCKWLTAYSLMILLHQEYYNTRTLPKLCQSLQVWRL